jgi:PPK2 family polyphosphate:nucleotide phosphotransferase
MGKNKHRKDGEGDRQSAKTVRDAVRVGPGFDLGQVDPGKVRIGPDKKKSAIKATEDLQAEAQTWHEKLWAEHKAGYGNRALLVVLQGMDTAGKGGASKAIDRMMDPLGFHVVSFGVPTDEEKAHHYLWRIERQLPPAGRVRLFDRSHYESVLVERVRNLVPHDLWAQRYDEINAWETGLADRGITIVKCMLHISRDEQQERLMERLERPDKYWKYNPRDVDERGLWDDYQAAYNDALVRCSTGHAPWYCIPADRKWHRNWILTNLVVETLRDMNPQYPPADFDIETEKARVRAS